MIQTHVTVKLDNKQAKTKKINPLLAVMEDKYIVNKTDVQVYLKLNLMIRCMLMAQLTLRHTLYVCYTGFKLKHSSYA